MLQERDLKPQVSSLSLIDSMDVTTVKTTLAKIGQFQTIVQSSLKKGHDYGVIPGTGKPTLLKPGAEKILMLMGISSEYDVTEKIQDYDKGFFAFSVKCTLTKGGYPVTEGLGHCNTKEKKYINQDPYTLANTCLKMAKKRSQIDATLTVASLSEIFTQDIEDMDQFHQAEQTETMTAQDAAKMVIRFGKHKGQTLRDIFKDDQEYLDWLSKQDRTDKALKKAISLLFNAAREKVEQKKKAAKESANSNDSKPENKKEDKDPFSDDPENVQVNPDDLPF